jgi:hypothetical protein
MDLVEVSAHLPVLVVELPTGLLQALSQDLPPRRVRRKAQWLAGDSLSA